MLLPKTSGTRARRFGPAAPARLRLDRISTGAADAHAAHMVEKPSQLRNNAAAFAAAAIVLAALLVPAGAAPAYGAASASDCALRLPAHRLGRQVVVPILMYHRVNLVTAATPASSRPLSVAPADFARQMRWLKRNGYRTITQSELFDALMCGRQLGPRPILLTFDDGYRDVFLNASRVLLRLHMHATAYVITDRISGGDISFLTWNLLHALEKRGIEIGSHTLAHRDLRSLPDAALLQELRSSRRLLERRLGHPTPWLAYPYGSYDARVEAMARRAGYLLAVTTQPGARESAARPLALPRLRVLDSTRVQGLAAMLRAWR